MTGLSCGTTQANFSLPRLRLPRHSFQTTWKFAHAVVSPGTEQQTAEMMLKFTVWKLDCIAQNAHARLEKKVPASSKLHDTRKLERDVAANLLAWHCCDCPQRSASHGAHRTPLRPEQLQNLSQYNLRLTLRGAGIP
ncbi:unnamed protein product, partial [Laminaria digitata]